MDLCPTVFFHIRKKNLKDLKTKQNIKKKKFTTIQNNAIKVVLLQGSSLISQIPDKNYFQHIKLLKIVDV